MLAAIHRTTLRGAGAAILLFSSFTPALPAQESDQPRVDPASFPEVVARVGGQEIRRVELLTQAELVRAQILRSGGPDPAGDPAFYREVLDGLVGEVLVYQYSRREGLGASPEEVSAKLREMSSRFADEAAFEKALAEQGTNREEVRRQLDQALSVERFIDREIAAAIEIPEESRRAFYQENLERMRVPERRRVRHILLRASKDSGAAARDEALRRAQDLRKRLETGTDFAALAEIHSEDEASKQKGGELGWIERTGRRPEFEAAAFSLAAGEVSEAVETAAGYHLIELLEVRPGKTPTYEEVAPRIEERMRAEIIQREIARRVEALRAAAEVEISI